MASRIASIPWSEFAHLALLALLWGSAYLFVRIAVAEIPPVTLIAARVSIAAIFLLAVLRWRGIALPRDPAVWRRLLVQALCNSIVSWTVLAWGLQYVDSGLAAVLNSTAPLFVFFITLLVTRHEALGWLKLGGALLGLGGVVLIVGVDALAGLGRHVAGQAAALAGAVLYAFAAIYGRRFAALPPAATAAGTMLWATVWLVPASLVLDRPWTLAPSAQAVAATLTLGLLCTGVALTIYFRLVDTLGSMGVASQGYLRAGVGVALGMVVLGEQISVTVAIGVVAALLGVAAINARLPNRR